MRVIAVASQKGGSGKTTLSGHLAVQAEVAGHGPVALIDTDPQGSLAAWWNARTADTPAFARTTLADLPDDLEVLRAAGVGLVVIDTPPAITTAIGEVIRVADFVVIPTRPSPHDLRAVGATVQLVRRCGKPLVFVVNDATPRARITSEAAIALSQHGTVAPITIHHRTDFASSMIDGRTVIEIKPDSRSALEVKALWDYLHARLKDEVVDMPFHLHDAAITEDTGRIAPTKAAAPARPAVARPAPPRAVPVRAAAAMSAPVADEAVFRALEAMEDAMTRQPEVLPEPVAADPVPMVRPAARGGIFRGFGRRLMGT
ncbi:MAG: ParA family protein [Rhodospirillaceae bacterium]